MVEPHPIRAPGMQLGPSLLDLLSSPEGTALRTCFHERTLASGALFFNATDKDQVFIVKRGKIRVYLATDERELSLSYLSDGDIFSTHTRAHLQAVAPTILLLADRHVLERELAEYPALRATIIRVLAKVLSQAINLIEDLAFHNVRGRIARYLLRSALRRNEKVETDCLVRVDLSMEELAALLGTTRQTASTELNAMLRSDVILRHDRRHFLIRDPNQLRAWASMGKDVS